MSANPAITHLILRAAEPHSDKAIRLIRRFERDLIIPIIEAQCSGVDEVAAAAMAMSSALAILVQAGRDPYAMLQDIFDCTKETLHKARKAQTQL